MSWPSDCETCATPIFTGKKAGQSQVHAWFVLDRDYCGPATINPVSIHCPAERKVAVARNAVILHRTAGRPPVKKAALITSVLRHAVDALPDTLAEIRDRALLLVGFAGALRRTPELAAVEIGSRGGAAVWIEDGADGLAVNIGHSKGDQEGAGQQIGIPFGSNPATCPVRAWRAWLQASALTEGPAFRSINRHGQMASDAMCDHAVALIVKRSIVAGQIASGSTPDEAAAAAKRFAGHSLRSGLATSAAANDAPGHLIQQQLRHKNTTSGYIQTAQLHRRNAAGMAGL